VLCCFTSEFTKKTNKITYKTDKNTNMFVSLLVTFDFLCEFTGKTTEHTVASYESSDFTFKIFNCVFLFTVRVSNTRTKKYFELLDQQKNSDVYRYSKNKSR
jgi:hypothetical protein